MKKRTRRFLAMLLATAMVLQQGSTLGVLAVETESVSEEATETMSVAETQETEAVEMAVSETAAEETAAPETATEETAAPETAAEETAAPETVAEETEAPETTAEAKVEETVSEETEVSEPATEAAAVETELPETTTEAASDETAAPETEMTEPATETTETTAEETKPTEPQTETAASETEAEPTTEISEPATEEVTESETVAEETAEPETEQISETETEQPSEAESEIETEVETDSEAESESETEAGPTLLTAECDGVTVTVEAGEGVLQAGTVLNMKKAAGKRVALEAIQGTLDEDTEVDKSKFLVYDITLMLDGEEVQPDGEVTVSFSNVPFEAEENEELIVAHLNEEEASPIGTISMFSATDGASGVEFEKGLSIKTTHFSVYAVGLLKKHAQNIQDDPNHNTGYDKWLNDPSQDLEGPYQPQNSFKFDEAWTDDKGSIHDYFDSAAFDFHIFARDVEIINDDATGTVGNHTNGNIAAQRYKGSDYIGTNQNMSGQDDVLEYNYFEQSVSGLKVNGGKTVLGNGIPWTAAGDGGENVSINGGDNQPGKNFYQLQDPNDKFIDFDAEFEKLEKLSKALAEQKSNVSKDTLVVPENQNDAMTIDLSSYPEAATYFLDVKASDFVFYGSARELLISGIENRTLIINVDMTGAAPDCLTYLQSKIAGYTDGEDLVKSNCNLMWNFYQRDANGNITTYKTEENVYAKVGRDANYFMGTILAPGANVHYGAQNGSVIAQKTRSGGKESHNWGFTGLSASLTVWKILEDPNGDAEPRTFTFGIFDENGKRVPGQRNRTVTVKPGERASVTFANLKPGTTYYVYEVDANGEPIRNGGPTSDGYYVSGDGLVIIPGDQVKKDVYITNSKTKKEEGNLTVTKTVTGNAGDKTKGFTFTVTLSDKTITGTYGDMTFKNGVVEFTLKHGESKTATGLPKGIDYTVVETDNQGYTVTKTGETGTISDGVTATAAFTNDKKTGGLSVSKTVTGNAGDKTKDFTFTVTLSDKTINGVYDDMEFEDGEATFTLKNGESSTATGLPVGVKYTVTESDNEGYTVTKTGETGTIVEGITATAAFTNDKKTGDLEVKKIVSGNAGDQEKKFSFRVELSESITGTYGDMTFTNGVAEFTLKHDESKKATDLPAGVTYTVEEEEANEGGYTTSASNANGTIAEGQSKVVVFENAKSEYGGLVVKKTVSGNSGEKDREFHFTVTLYGMIADDTYGDMTFTNGVADFTLKHGESATASDLPVGLIYKVEEEAADGYVTEYNGVTDSTEATGTTKSGKVDVVEVTNTRNLLGDLSVSKTVTGNAGDTEKEFSFRVELSEPITGTYKDMEFENGVATFKLKHGESKKAIGLPAGVTYTVTESDNEGYTVTKEGDTGTITGNTEKTAKFTNNKDEYGNLSVKKIVAGNAGDTNKEFHFKVELDKAINGKYGDMTFKDGVASFTLRHNETKTARRLPIKVNYVVTETEAGQDGYKTESTGTTGEISANKTLRAEFKNTKDVGSLTVTKTFAGDLKAENLTDDQKKAITFEVYGPTPAEGEAEKVAGFSYYEMTNGSKTITGLVPGEYVVKETNGNLEGYTVETKYSVTDGKTTVTAGGTATVTVTNTYTQEKGSLKVTKSFAGDTLTEDQKAEITFTVTGPNYSNTFTYADMTDGSMTLENLVPGEYTVTESKADVEGYTVETKYSVEGGKTTVEANKTAEIVVTNTYTQKKGSLKVTKNFAGDALTDAQKAAVTFTVTGPNNYKIEFTYADMTDGSKTLENLVPGEYTVTESKADVDGYTVVTSYSVTDGKATVVAEQTAAVTVTNTYTQKKGSLKVTKSFAGDALTDDQKKAVTFTVAGPDGYTNEFTYADMADGSKTLENLVPGEYTVTESKADVDGYTVETKYSVEGGKATVVAEQTAMVAVTNTYTQKKGSLKVTKSFAGDALTDDQKKAVTFTVTGPDGYKSEFTYADMADGSKTLENLVPGEYTVTESKADVDGYKVETKYSVEGGKTTVEANKTAEIVVTNTYTQEKGSLKIKKNVTVNGKATIGTDADGTYKFEVKDANGQKVGETVEITVTNGASGEATVNDLATGTYTVSEVTDGLKAGMSLVGNNDIEVKVEVGETAKVETAEFTNNMVIVKVSKVDVADGKELEGAHIQILDKDGNVVEEWDSTKEAHEVKGLKTGETYTLKETVAPDGYTLASETTFTLNEDGTVDSGRTTTKSDKDGVLLVEDSMNKVSILKVDEDGKALKGATLVIKDADGEIAEKSWKTNGKAHDITGLAAGTYTLSEIEAPEGYNVSKDVTFEITGKETAGQTISVTMTDKKIPKDSRNSLRVTKRLRLMDLDGNETEFGIEDATFYVALYSDEARTERVSGVKQIVFKNAEASTVTFDNLDAATYYVGETDENGTPLTSGLLGEALYNPEYGDSAQFTFEGKNQLGDTEFTNMFLDIPNGLYLSGRITITKKILVNGEEGTSDATYYARIFSDPDLKEPVGDEVIALDLAGGSSASVTVTDLPIGTTLDSSMTYYVAETDENGTPLDPGAVTGFEISIDKSEIVLDANNREQEVVITNSFTEEEESETELESETEIETETETETETEVSEKKAAPKTGDDTNFMLYLMLMVLSAGTCAVVFEKRRRAGRVRK